MCYDNRGSYLGDNSGLVAAASCVSFLADATSTLSSASDVWTADSKVASCTRVLLLPCTSTAICQQFKRTACPKQSNHEHVGTASTISDCIDKSIHKSSAASNFAPRHSSAEKEEK